MDRDTQVNTAAYLNPYAVNKVLRNERGGA